MTTLDEVFADAVDDLGSPRVLLKIDTQGWDLQVLRGERASLAQIAALQLEVSVIGLYDGEPSYLELLSVVDELGFAPGWFEPVVLDREYRPPQFDCLLRLREPT